MTVRRVWDHVVFDWNGTLLDDVSLAVQCTNFVLRHYGVDEVSTDRYRRAFRLPIKGFYEALSITFDKVELRSLLALYASRFDGAVLDCPLVPGSRELLLHLSEELGCELSILSASQQGVLESTVRARDIAHYFRRLLGIHDTAVDGKHVLAEQLQRASGVPPTRTLYIGDTLHDANVAQSVGWDFLGYTGGHQDLDRWISAGVPVISSMEELRRAVSRPSTETNEK
jgi:phosphoglycolate phosphatase